MSNHGHPDAHLAGLDDWLTTEPCWEDDPYAVELEASAPTPTGAGCDPDAGAAPLLSTNTTTPAAPASRLVPCPEGCCENWIHDDDRMWDLLACPVCGGEAFIEVAAEEEAA